MRTAIAILGAVIVLLAFCQSLTMARSEALQQLYDAEQQSWQEYMIRFADVYPDSTFDVTFYYINIDVAVDSEYIAGDVRCLFTVLEDGIDLIRLNLQDSLGIDSITGNCSSFTHSNDTIYISLDRAYSQGETAEVHVFYQGDPPLINGTKALRYNTHGSNEIIIASLSTPYLAHYWWPCKDGPGDKPDSVYLDVTIPDTVINGFELTVVSNGTLDNTFGFGGKKTFQWRERYPIVTYYVMIAISNYHIVQQQYTHPDGDFPLVYTLFNETLSESLVGLSDLPDVMDFFSSIFGPYPFRNEKYGISELGFYGGIENQTNTIQNRCDLSYFSVTIHELSHMWFADMITCRDWHHGWVNEGFASYSEALWTEHTQGPTAYREAMELMKYFGPGSVYLDDTSDPFQVFIAIIYNKGAWVLHMLRGVLGDEVFFDCLYQYATSSAFMYDHATTEDFQQVCETVSGEDLDYFFQQWIYGTYFPAYQYSYVTRLNPDPTGPNFETHIHVSQTQSTDPMAFHMPIDFQLWYASGYSIEKRFNDAREEDIVILTEFNPDSVRFDPFDNILSTVQRNVYTLHLITDSLDDGNLYTPYADTIRVICNSGAFRISVIEGELPDGLSLGEFDGILSGVPTTIADTGSLLFTVYAEDMIHLSYHETRQYSIYIKGGLPGDANNDYSVNIGDAVFIIQYIFNGGAAPTVANTADANQDCSINVGDAVYLINYIFRGGPSPLIGCVE
ncbi:MAG: M1 family aminopeptidase [Candidatus Zixiibacteriota bacterium]